MKKSPEQIAFARELRHGQTDAEKALWASLRNQQLEGVRFRRQQPIGPYIVDFVCFERKVVIEIDGGQHGEGRLSEVDAERSGWLERSGYRVLRFWNNEVLTNKEGVLERTKRALG